MRPAGAPDSLGIWEAAWGLAEQVERAADTARVLGARALPEREAVENVVVLGMGGSGLAGDVLAAVAAPFMSVPVTVVKSYVLPAFVSDASLVFAVSFSGDTEETVEAAGEALAAQARVVVVTGGGELARIAERAELATLPVPRDIPAPRAALGALAVPMLVALETMGLYPGASGWIELAVAQLRRRREQLAAPDGPAAELAQRIGRTIPIVHSSRSLGSAAAQRWKTQVNENAKRPAFWSSHPELCHNEVAGWARHRELSEGTFTLVALRHDSEHPQVARRFEQVAELLGGAFAGTEEVRAEGDGELAQLLDLVLFGDVVSLHLAASEGLDPGPVDIFQLLKQRLRRA